MAQVQLTDHLVRGQVYTFTFSYSGSASSSDFADSANQVQGVSQAFVQDLEAFTVAITFAYSGDGSDTVAALANNIGNTLPVDSADIVSASVPGVAPPQTQMQTSTAGAIYGGAASAATSVADAAKSAASGIQSLIPSGSTLWAVAAIGVLVLFVYVGGAGVVKRNIA